MAEQLDFSQSGKKWSSEEETQLLEEIEKNINLNEIAKNHKRSYGGILGRIKQVAYEMYSNNVSKEEIYKQTRLNKEELEETIKSYEYRNTQKKLIDNTNTKTNKIDEITSMKEDIKEMKDNIKKILEFLNKLELA